MAGSREKVWWYLPYDDPKTGKHFNFEWQAVILNRNRGSGCPYLTTYKGEEYIKQYLQKDNISFNVQQKFSDLLGTGDGQLSYDFSIPDEKYGLILNMSAGKLAAQVSHASMAFLTAPLRDAKCNKNKISEK